MDPEPLHPVQLARLRAMTPEEKRPVSSGCIRTGMPLPSSAPSPRNSLVEEPHLIDLFVRPLHDSG
ncbi:MAG: hypothetical protein PHC88_07585, partial [Terrimicrobiaceae bacterium]|nr:hypothetical protein [Terrimicrobiaceae bacterium]